MNVLILIIFIFISCGSSKADELDKFSIINIPSQSCGKQIFIKKVYIIHNMYDIDISSNVISQDLFKFPHCECPAQNSNINIYVEGKNEKIVSFQKDNNKRKNSEMNFSFPYQGEEARYRIEYRCPCLKCAFPNTPEFVEGSKLSR